MDVKQGFRKMVCRSKRLKISDVLEPPMQKDVPRAFGLKPSYRRLAKVADAQCQLLGLHLFRRYANTGNYTRSAHSWPSMIPKA